VSDEDRRIKAGKEDEMEKIMNEREETGCLAVGCTEPVVPGMAACRTHYDGLEPGMRLPRGVCWVDECPGKPRRGEFFCSTHYAYQEFNDFMAALMVEAGFCRPVGKTEWGDPIYESLVFDKSIEEKKRDLEARGFDLETLRPKEPFELPFKLRRPQP
jgi:hypothetical protein